MGVPLIILTFGAAALPAAVLLFAIENFASIMVIPVVLWVIL